MRRELSERMPELEGAGRALAVELQTQRHQAVTQKTAREREQAENEEWVITLREGMFGVVRGFNVEAPTELQVAMLDRGDRMVFHAGVQKTLTVIYGEDCVILESKSDYPRLPMPMSLRVWRDRGGDLRYRAVPDSPVFPQPVMTHREFLLSVLRMACNQNINEFANC